MRILFFIGMVFVGFITGSQKIYLSLSESKATEISYENLLKDGITKSWVKVTNAQFSIMDSYYIKGFTRIKKLYIPLTPPEGKQIKYFFVTDDDELLEKFSAIEKIEDEVQVILQMGKLYKIVEKHKHFSAMTDEFDDIPDEIKKQLKKESNVIKEPVFFIHNEKPDLGEGVFFLGFGALGIFLLYNSFKGDKNKTPVANVASETKEATTHWPTLLDEQGQAPTLMELLADPNPSLNLQASYLTRILTPIQESYEVKAVQVPLQKDQLKLTAPAELRSKTGEDLYLYSEANVWGEQNFQILLYWIEAFRTIYPEGKVLVYSAHESEYVKDLPNVAGHVVLP